jgi:peptidoglycan biosynthesis protein MviN/MurJ (putative lipid II flippase)
MSVGAFVILAKIVAAAKEMVVAAHYGVSGVVDAYLIALTISTWLPTIVVSIGTCVLVPKLVALTKGSTERKHFIAELNGTTATLAAFLVVLSALAGPWIVPWMMAGMSSANQATTRVMVLQLSPLALLTLAAGLMSIRLQASERHGYALAEAAPAVGILVFVSFALHGTDPGPLLWGTLAGTAAQAVWTSRMSRSAEGTLGGLSLRRTSLQWKGLYGALWIMGFGSLIMGLTVPVDQFFAARLGEGSVAALGYANRVVALATGLGAVAIGRALLPVLCNAVATGQTDLGRDQAVRWAWIALACGVVAAAVGWRLTPWGVALLFERGSFTASDTQVVSTILRASLVQLPFYFGGIVLVQWLTALGRFKPLLYVAVIAILSKILLNAALVGPYGTAGIALSTAVVYALSFFMQLGMTGRRSHA